MPDDVGVPLIVIVLDTQDAVTPDGKPLVVLIPVVPVVLCVISGRAVLIHNVVVALLLAVLSGVTMMVPIAFTVPHPPTNGIV